MLNQVQGVPKQDTFTNLRFATTNSIYLETSDRKNIIYS